MNRTNPDTMTMEEEHAWLAEGAHALGLTSRTPKRVTIKRCAPDGREAGANYTNDKQDAIGTCRAIYGSDVVITFRSVQGW